MSRRCLRLPCSAIIATITTLCGAGLSAADVPAPVDYLRQIKPMLQERCYACHGALKQEANLRLDAVSLMRRGGDGGSAVVPGNPQESELLRRVSAADPAERMPPEGQPLSPEQITLLRDWIGHGAPTPADDRPEPNPREHWSFRTPQRPSPPTVADPAWNVNPIDRFIAAEHERRGLRPAEPASPEVLLRRVYLDLIGLPPSAAEVEEFVRACSSASPRLSVSPSSAAETETRGHGDGEHAYEALVDRLLASPQYGERWARHWMDVWRYSDWYGRRGENDVRNSYPHVWRWRDWIVRSLNDDKGYDRMLVEMLAGDEIAPDDDDVIAATGYLVRSFYSLNYDQWMRDVVDHLGKGFLGLRTGCALCHDHKYDPLSQRDYFALRAFFEPLELRQDRVPGGPPLAKFTRYQPGSGSALRPIEAGLARIYDDRQTEPTYLYRGGDARDRFEGEPTVEPGVPAIFGVPLPKIEPVSLSPTACYPGAKPWVRRDALRYAERQLTTASAAWSLAQAKWEELPADPARRAALDVAAEEWQLAVIRRQATAASIQADDAAMSHDDDADAAARRAARLDREATVVVERIAVINAAETLRIAQSRAHLDERRKQLAARAETTLTAARKKLAEAEESARRPSFDYARITPSYPSQSTGRRTALAQWLTSPDHPLTARVAVNHIWNWHFGKPLAPTVYDLGRAGGDPSHRELLDWLAVELMEGDGGRWSMKRLHRQIVTSRAYRLSSDDRAAATTNAALDPANRYLWKFERRRMEAEVLRDSLLAMSGLLDLTLGGPDLDNARAESVPRRSLYFTRHPEAGGVMPFLEQFDAPSPGECYRRTESLIPQQALALENGELPHAVSRALAQRLRNETDAASLIEAAFRQILNRAPRAAERTACLAFLARRRAEAESPADGSSAADRAVESLVRVLLNHHDLITIH